MLECIEIISIAMQKGIRIYTVKGNWQLDDSIQSKVKAVMSDRVSPDRVSPDRVSPDRVSTRREPL